MPLEKLEESKKEEFCCHPEHNPPSHLVLEGGEYRYTCPGCGKEIVFRVLKPSF